MSDVTSTCGPEVLSTLLRCLSMEFGNSFECIHRAIWWPKWSIDAYFLLTSHLTVLSRENAFYTFQYSGYVFIPVCSVNLSSVVLTLSFLVSMRFEGPLKPPFTPAIVWFYNFISDYACN